MSGAFFTEVTEPIRFEGLASTNPLAFKVYDPDRVVLGKRDGGAPPHRASASGTRSPGPGVDMFGVGTLDRPWLDRARRPDGRGPRRRWPSAFEFFTKLGIAVLLLPRPRRRARRARPSRSSSANLDALVDDALGYQERTGVRLLWGTANLFTHPRYQAGAATNPDPEVFAYAAAQVKHMLEVTQRLGGENYVLWGGREGYDTLLNTDLRREGDQLARFLHLVAEHKHKIGFTGQLLIEPKPMEPTKHQYDYDAATVHGFLVRNGLEDEYQLNIEANHATLAGHSFHHEVAFAVANGDPRQHRRQPRRPAERLGHRPVPELGRGPRPAAVRDPARRRPRDRAASTSTPSCAARAPTGPTCSTPTSAASTRSPGPCSWPPTCIEQRRRWPTAARPATRAGTATLGQRDPRRLASRCVARGEGRRRARSTRARASGQPGALENVVNQPRSGPRTADPDGPRPRHRRLDDGDQGRPRRRGRRGRRRRRRRVRLRDAAAAVERAGPGAVVGRRRSRRSAPCWPRPGVSGADVAAVGLTGQMHGLVLLDAADAVLRPAILWNDQRTAARLRRDPRGGRGASG